jgi:hypothetical protein
MPLYFTTEGRSDVAISAVGVANLREVVSSGRRSTREKRRPRGAWPAPTDDEAPPEICLDCAIMRAKKTAEAPWNGQRDSLERGPGRASLAATVLVLRSVSESGYYIIP